MNFSAPNSGKATSEDLGDKGSAKRGLWARLFAGVDAGDSASSDNPIVSTLDSYILTPNDVENVYRLFLGRQAESPEVRLAWVGKSLAEAIPAFLESLEFEERVSNPLAADILPSLNVDWLSFGRSTARWAAKLPLAEQSLRGFASAQEWPAALAALFADPQVCGLIESPPEGAALTAWAKIEHDQLLHWDEDRKLIESHFLLDQDWYRQKYGLSGDVSAAYDYLVNWRNGRDPSRFFSNEAYLGDNPDVAAAGLNPLMHWLRHGDAEGRTTPVPWRGTASGRPPSLRLSDLCDPLREEFVPEAPKSGVKISVVTPAYNTTPYLLHELHQSLRNQTYGRWQWVVCDDGSTNPLSIAALREIAARDPRVVLLLEDNGGISSATNKALAKADGEYIALVDHDDLLSRNVFQKAIEAINASEITVDILYTDEAKLTVDGHIASVILKPGWSPALLESTMYIGHLTFYRSALLREVGEFRTAYDGTQDFDMALRMSAAAKTVVHVQYVGYLWRAIEGSAAATLDAKSYAIERQQKAVEDLARKQWPRATVRPGFNPGYWQIDYPLDQPFPSLSYVIPTAGRSRNVRGVPVDLLSNCIAGLERSRFYRHAEIVIVHNGDLSEDQLAFLAARSNVKLVLYDEPVLNLSMKINAGVQAASGDYVCLLNDDVEAITEGGGELLVGYMESHPQVGAIAPLCLFEDGAVQHNGVLLTENGPAHAGAGQPLNFFGYAFLHCRREQFAVTGAMMFVKRQHFIEAGGFDESLPLNYNDVDFCLRLRDKGLSCVVDPHVSVFHYESASKVGLFKCERERFFSRWPDISDPYFNQSHNQRATNFHVADFVPAGPPDSTAFEKWLDFRISRGRGVTENGPSFSVCVSIYNQSSALLNEMVTSIMMQTYKNFEFVIFDNGSTNNETRRWLGRSKFAPNVRLLAVEKNIGILGGQRALLEAAKGDFLIPIDADDFLTVDALAVMAQATLANPDKHYFYSDEFKSNPNSDKFSPFFKTDFDPVAIANCCFPTHLMAWRRSYLNDIRAYSDDRASWCHDWDTTFRALAAGDEPVHVPELLYAWRINPGSTASMESGNKPETVSSQAFVLERAIEARGLKGVLRVEPNRFGPRTGMWSLETNSPASDVAILSAVDVWGGARGIDTLVAHAKLQSWTAIIAGRSERQRAETVRLLSAPAIWDDRVGVVSGGVSMPAGEKVAWSGRLFTPKGLFDPSVGEAWSSGGDHGRLYCQRCIDVALPVDVLISSRRLLEAVDYLTAEGAEATADSLMVALGILAARDGWFVAMTPAVRLVLPTTLRHVIPVDRLGLAAGMTSRWYNPENSLQYPFTPGDYKPTTLFGLD